MTAIPSASFAEPPGGWANLVQQVSPAVVYIEVTETAAKSQQEEQQNMPDFPFQEFSRRFGIPFPGMPQQQIPQGRMHGVGSGFIISPDGYIVTNNHVVAGAQTIKVKLTDGKDYTAKVIGRDPGTDLALLRVDAELVSTKWADDESLRVVGQVGDVGPDRGRHRLVAAVALDVVHTLVVVVLLVVERDDDRGRRHRGQPEPDGMPHPRVRPEADVEVVEVHGVVAHVPAGSASTRRACAATSVSDRRSSIGA